jgi:hypothetical protein
MKIIKTYALSEKTLEKDIDKFIRDAKNGAYQYDYKYGQEGLKIIKAYFRMINDEFKKQNFQDARACYKKLLSFLMQTDHNYFNYEDILAKFNSEKIVGLYFTCLIKTCNADELFHEYIEYLKFKEDYYFESAEKAIMEELDKETLDKFKALLLKEADKIGKEDYAMQDVLTFLMDIVKKKDKDEKMFKELAEKFAPILEYDNAKDILEEYEE